MSHLTEIALICKSGLLRMVCPLCNFRMKRVELREFNLCDGCDSDVEALPSKNEKRPDLCESGRWNSRIA